MGDLIVKFQREEHKITGLVGTDTVSDLKNAIYKATQVCPERQKLLGLKIKGKIFNTSRWNKPFLFSYCKDICLFVKEKQAAVL